MTTPDKFFKPSVFVNEDNVKKFRNLYRILSKVTNFDGHEIEKESLLSTARQLEIQVHSTVHEEILAASVKCDDEDQAFFDIDTHLVSTAQQPPSDHHPKATPPVKPANNDKLPVILKELKCVLIIKRRNKDMDTFLRTFLLQTIKKTSSNAKNNADSWSSESNNIFLLHPGSLLALFIHERMKSLGTIRRPQIERLRLVEPFQGTDEFGTWSYDHLRNLFEIELHSHVETNFPPCWTLANDARIHCQFIFSGTRDADGTTIFGMSDRPRTDTLEQFVEDVCAKEENGKAEDWLKLLRAEDIRTFTDLSNLKQTEWDNIKKLSMNAKRILKMAVDRERESVADDRRRLFEESSPNEVLSRSTDDTIKESRAELLANLHLIKLFVYHTLRFERSLQDHGALPKLEKNCIKLSFAEIRKEGYADDGLFPKMEDFFLPLTISEQELKMSKSNVNKLIRQGQLKDHEKEADHLKNLLNEATMHRWDVDEKITDLNKAKDQTLMAYTNERSQLHTNSTSREQARKLQHIDQEWEVNRQQFEAQLLSYDEALNLWLSRIAEYEKQLDDCSNKISNIQNGLNQPELPIDKGLVKPARGFIMYGPPGTGKSEIMSKLSVKLGIAMVGPPLAAGELNRPLVGESERVIIALASRCYRIPYAMCCLSIDEIDSLAPKRDEDSSEGKVDKISVLLSLIDGIKDVPNLMIFCATNRLHMMDEAFLRRMSGKFFVGRPSSQARTNILTEIPEWALELDIIDQLVIATTNFSGAACRAFTRAITVHCMNKQRENSAYHVKYKKALKIADHTAQQYQIFLGSETLPRLLMRRLMTGLKIRRNHITRHMYTGRIIINIPGGSARIEIIESNGHIGVVEHELSSHETNVQGLLERLTIYGKDRNVQLLQLVDLNLLASQGAFDEKKVFETLKERYDECIAYARSMIIYDLDALVGVNKSESNSSMGQSMSSSIVNQSVYTYVCARFREAVVEQLQQQSQPRDDDGDDDDDDEQQELVEKWAIIVVQDPFLLRHFSTNVNFARTRLEEKEHEIERSKAKDLLKCVKCKDFYIENENKMGNCVHHDGFIYDNSAPDLATYSQSDVIFALNKLESEAINHSDRREKIDQEKSKFKWICCDATVTVGAGTGGCKKGRHGFGERVHDGYQRDGGRLDQKAIKEWEENCRRNQEYNERWLLLLEDRSSH